MHMETERGLVVSVVVSDRVSLRRIQGVLLTLNSNPRSRLLAVIVTCGSVIKLRHELSGFHLHSHTIKWGGGSGQQSVTAHGSEDDQGSMWIVSPG